MVFGNGRKEFGMVFTRHELQALLGDGPIEAQVKNFRLLRTARKIIDESQDDDYLLRVFLHSRPSLEDPLSFFEHWMHDDDGPEWVLEKIRETFGDDDSGGGEPPESPEPRDDGGLTFADFEREVAETERA